MPEAGGSTTQSGIYYQNAIAARYLGRMLQPLTRPPAEQVSEVRVEAPEHVDDVVVSFADGHHWFIQVKENIDPSGEAWKKMWADFEKQHWEATIQPDDRLVLFLGNAHGKYNLLNEACERARGASDPAEWLRRLNGSQTDFVDKNVKKLLLTAHQTDLAVWELLRQVEVRIETVKMIEETAPYWMPPSSLDGASLFQQLVGLVTEQARIKAPFTLNGLRERLQNQNVIIYAEWKPPQLKITWTVPYRSLEHRFVGRQRELEALKRRVEEASRVGIVGMGGLGKTQLAVEYAYRCQDEYPHGIFWINAANPLLAELAELSETLGLAGPKTPHYLAAFAMRDYLEKNPLTLLIYDNLIDPHQLNEPVAPGLIPSALKGRLLFTTRQRDFPDNLIPFEIKVLEEEPALRLLLSGRPAILNPTHHEHEAAQKIVAALGGLPLALELVAAYFAKFKKATLPGYLDLLNSKGSLSSLDLSLKYTRLSEADLATRHTVALDATLQVQWEALDDPDARRLFLTAGQLLVASWIPIARLGLLAQVSGQPEPGIEVTLLDVALQELSAASLVEELSGERLRLHPLVHGFAHRLTPDPEALQTSMVKNLLQALQDASFFQRQIELRGIEALIADLDTGRVLAEAAGDGELRDAAKLLKMTLLSSAQILESDPHQLSGQYTGRLAGIVNPTIQGFIQKIRETNVHPWLRPLSPTLRSPEDPLRAVLSGHEGTVRSLAITPDGERAISAGNSTPDVTLRIWDLHNCLEIFRVEGEIEAGDINPVGLTPNGVWALCAISNRIRRWDIRTKTAAGQLEGHQGKIKWLAVADASPIAISCSDRGELITWDLEAWTLIRRLPIQGESIERVVITPDGKTALSISTSTCQVWDVEKGLLLYQHGIEPAYLGGYALGAFYLSVDGRWAQIGAHRWIFASQEWYQNIDLPVQFEALALADGARLLLAREGYSSNLLGLDGQSGSEQFTLQAAASQAISTLAVTPDGKRAIVAYHDHYLRFWALDRAKKRAEQPEALRVQEIHLLPGANRAGIWLEGGQVEVYNIFTGAPDTTSEAREALQAAIQENQQRQAQMDRFKEDFVKPAGLVQDQSESKENGDWIIPRDEAILDLRAGLALTTRKNRGKVSEAEEDDSDDGIEAYDYVRLWNMVNAQPPILLKGHTSPVLSGQIDQDGRLAVTSAIGRLVRVWDLERGEQKFDLRGHQGMVFCVRLDPLERYAVSASEDRSIKVWDLGKGELLTAFTTDAPLIHCAVGRHAESGKMLVVAAEKVGRLHFLILEDE